MTPSDVIAAVEISSNPSAALCRVNANFRRAVDIVFKMFGVKDLWYRGKIEPAKKHVWKDDGERDFVVETLGVQRAAKGARSITLLQAVLGKFGLETESIPSRGTLVENRKSSTNYGIKLTDQSELLSVLITRHEVHTHYGRILADVPMSIFF